MKWIIYLSVTLSVVERTLAIDKRIEISPRRFALVEMTMTYILAVPLRGRCHEVTEGVCFIRYDDSGRRIWT